MPRCLVRAARFCSPHSAGGLKACTDCAYQAANRACPSTAANSGRRRKTAEDGGMPCRWKDGMRIRYLRGGRGILQRTFAPYLPYLSPWTPLLSARCIPAKHCETLPTCVARMARDAGRSATFILPTCNTALHGIVAGYTAHCTAYALPLRALPACTVAGRLRWRQLPAAYNTWRRSNYPAYLPAASAYCAWQRSGRRIGRRGWRAARGKRWRARLGPGLRARIITYEQYLALLSGHVIRLLRGMALPIRTAHAPRLPPHLPAPPSPSPSSLLLPASLPYMHTAAYHCLPAFPLPPGPTPYPLLATSPHRETCLKEGRNTLHAPAAG